MKILVIQLRRIGDVLMTTPAIRALRAEYKNSEIHYLTEKPSLDVLCNNEYIDKVMAVRQVKSYTDAIKVGLSLRHERYDIVIDAYSHYMSGLISLLTGAKTRIGFKLRMRGLFFNELVKISKELTYSPYHKLELLKPLGINSEDVRLDFFISEEERKYAENLLKSLGVSEDDILVTISPVSRRAFRVWDCANYAKVADYLISKFGAKVLFMYGPNEEHFIHNVRSKMAEKALPNYPVPTLAETKAIFEKATLHIGNNNGPYHIAVSAGIPVFCIFGKDPAKDWSPKGKTNVHVFEHHVECRNKCTFPDCKSECLEGVKPEDIINKIDEVLNAK